MFELPILLILDEQVSGVFGKSSVTMAGLDGV